MQQEVLKIISEVAKEYDVPPYVLERAFKNQFKVLKELISSSRETENFPIIYIRHIGKFIPRKKFIERSNEFRKPKSKGDNTGLEKLSDT
jgi:hypothetical protein